MEGSQIQNVTAKKALYTPCSPSPLPAVHHVEQGGAKPKAKENESRGCGEVRVSSGGTEPKNGKKNILPTHLSHHHPFATTPIDERAVNRKGK